MPTIYYGNGECELDATDAVYCEMRVKYPIEVDDKTPYDYITVIGGNSFIVSALFRTMESSQRLKELFTYVGDLVIIKATIMKRSGERQRCTLKKVMDYAELLDTNAEDMTNKSEDLKTTSIKLNRVSKMKLVNPIIEGLKSEGYFFLEDGTEYVGLYHIHQETGQRMTGNDHTEESQSLYFKDEIDGVIINKLILFNNKNISNRPENKIRKFRNNAITRSSSKIGRGKTIQSPKKGRDGMGKGY